MRTQVKVGGVDLDGIATVSDLEDSTIWRAAWDDGGYSGDYEATWTWAAPLGFSAEWFHAGATVEIVEGGGVTWTGILGDPEQDGRAWTLTAYGTGSDASNYPSDPDAGANLNDNVDSATSSGMLFSRYSNSLSASIPPGEALMLNEVLDIAAKTLGKVWWVSCGEISMRAETTSVDWLMVPDSTYLGTTDQQMVTRLGGLYVSAVDGDGNPSATDIVYVEDTAASKKFGVHGAVIDLRKLGLLIGSAPTTYTQARFDQVGARSGYTNPFTMTRLNSSDIRTGVPDPMGARAGHRARLPGITDMRTGVTYLTAAEVTLGKVRRQHATETAICDPLGLVPRDFMTALAAAQEKPTKVETL